jgi:hypothetical protein
VQPTTNSLSYKREKCGVYFLADDFASEWTIALLNSLHAYAPMSRVWCIPFSEEISGLRQLAGRFGFGIYDDTSLLELDNIAHSLLPDIGRMAGTFRKLTVFWGPLERFIYLDADVVILGDVEPLFITLLKTNYDLLYAHADLEMAYKPGPFRERMVRKYQTHGFVTGVWASTLGQLSLAEICEFSAEVASDIGSFAPTLEQPFVNYCMDRKRTRMRSFASASEDSIYWNWPGQAERLHVRALDQSRLQVYTDGHQPVSGMHWAGFSLGPQMPHYEIYRYFRFLSSTRIERVTWKVRKWVTSLARDLPSLCRRLPRRLLARFCRQIIV